MLDKTKKRNFALIALIILLFGVTYFFFDSEIELFNNNKYVIFFAIIATVISLVITIINSFAKGASSGNSVAIESDKTRLQLNLLLERVEHDWVKGVLEDSVHHAVLMN